MKMARASKADLDALHDFFRELQEAYEGGDDRAAVGKIVERWWRKVEPAWCRVVYGYQVLVDNCCDPAASALEWKPDILAAMTAAGLSG